MQDAGFGSDSHRDLLWSMALLSSVNAISNFVGTILNKTMGRRQLMLMFCIPMGISLIVLVGAMLKNQLSPDHGSARKYLLWYNYVIFSSRIHLYFKSRRLSHLFLHWFCIITMDHKRRNFPSINFLLSNSF